MRGIEANAHSGACHGNRILGPTVPCDSGDAFHPLPRSTWAGCRRKSDRPRWRRSRRSLGWRGIARALRAFVRDYRPACLCHQMSGKRRQTQATSSTNRNQTTGKPHASPSDPKCHGAVGIKQSLQCKTPTVSHAERRGFVSHRQILKLVSPEAANPRIVCRALNRGTGRAKRASRRRAPLAEANPRDATQAREKSCAPASSGWVVSEDTNRLFRKPRSGVHPSSRDSSRSGCADQRVV